jgi:hypothetical protein
MNRRTSAAIASLLLVSSLFTAQACGPDFSPDVFVRKLRPDNPKQFAQGKLGILLPTYPRTDLVVAFRYLNGGQLSPAEQEAYEPTFTYTDSEMTQTFNREEAEQKKTTEPAESWPLARAKYAALGPKVEQERAFKVQLANGASYTDNYLNCNGDAFRTAVLTLDSRAKTWGGKSPELADWLKGQDAVFANCNGGAAVLPVSAPDGSPVLLKEDRAYQTAAAEFYAEKFEDARAAFGTIAQDSNSPWHGIALYLAARSLVREAFHAKDSGDYGSMATFDDGLMRQAAAQLKALLNEPHPGISQRAIQNELDLVRLRTEPMARLKELSAALAGPETDANYAQHLADLTWYLNAQLDGMKLREDSFEEETVTAQEQADGFGDAWQKVDSLRGSSTLVDWLITFQSPAAGASGHAIKEWRKTGQLYWLVAALVKAGGKEAGIDELLKASEQVTADSPAWELVEYHRARLLIATGNNEGAKALLAQLMPKIQASGHESSVNLFLQLRTSASTNLNEFLTYAPRKIIDRTSEEESSLDECLDVMKDPKRAYACNKNIGDVQFSGDAADFLNREAPLSTLIEAANSENLPEQLRRAVAMSAWVRAVLLKDDAAAAKLFPLLPQKLQAQAGKGTGFQPILAIARNPGLRPFLEPGVQRSYSWDFVESYGDNWWCKGWQASPYSRPGNLVGGSSAQFLTPAEKSAANREYAELGKQDSAEIYLGGEVIAYAKGHADDKDVPESLYLVLRMIRYGCNRVSDYTPEKEARRSQLYEIKEEAARLLRERYAKDPWTKKAAPFAG